jgi:hypothetical protein
MPEKRDTGWLTTRLSITSLRAEFPDIRENNMEICKISALASADQCK